MIIDSCKVVAGKVIIDGRLRKDINFKTLDTGLVPPRPGTFLGCSGIVNTATGNVAHTTVDIAFAMMVPVVDARNTDTCVVLEASVEGENEEPVNVTAAGTFTAIVDKTVVRVRVKVVRPAVVEVEAAAEEEANVAPGPQPGTFVGPTIGFPGPVATR